ncbi:MAG: hypothetical protein AMXMBFR53_09130 [Gemmatimonadota bacterium]
MTSGAEMDDLLTSLQERAKELQCLYEVMNALARVEAPLEETVDRVLRAIPPGWQYPGICHPVLTLRDQVYHLPESESSEWSVRADIKAGGNLVGHLTVYYSEPRPAASGPGPFLQEEQQLLTTLADRIGLYLMERGWVDGHPSVRGRGGRHGGPDDWRTILSFLDRSDQPLLRRLTGKMLNVLRWKGLEEARRIAGESGSGALHNEENRPQPRSARSEPPSPRAVFELAEQCCSSEEILNYILMWLGQEKVKYLLSTVEEQSSSLTEITDALGRFAELGVPEDDLPASVQTTLKVALLRRFFTEDLPFLNIAKSLVRVDDFRDLAERVIHPPRSHGKLGGKSAGLFLAGKIVEAAADAVSILREIRTPRTWHIASDGILAFVRHNNLEDVHDRKYLDIEHVREQYPHVVEVFKDSAFPPELVQGLSAALDDLGDSPLIVRSSSLLEDRVGSAFSGKYKSLFLANQGPKAERLRALQDAIAEVYASMFGPDPIEYRAERNLLDVHEEMGVMIQEVVGSRVGPYYLPAFSGVAFTNNEFRWSPRIAREDGLVRLVPGLGTRAVDRIGDDYPVLLTPGQPGLRANSSIDEVQRYSPKMVDVINLETNDFETVPVALLVGEYGADLPLLNRMISVVENDRLRRPRGVLCDPSREPTVVTFEGLAVETPFLARMGTLLSVLGDRLGTPVDVEFASDGKSLYLLQCRPQSYGGLAAPPSLPLNPAPENVLFTAARYVSNGVVSGLTHVVYVDPHAYSRLDSIDKLRDVGRAVGRLNKILPKRRFVLMGPGRWGSRGDVRLGVSVSYSDINNTALLIEIARRRGDYAPDLSFGTHFFQDLVEAGIRYLPLYPDDVGNRFDERFFLGESNLLPTLVPDFGHLGEVLRVIDVPASRHGMCLDVLMNGEVDRAVGLLVPMDEHGKPTAEPPSLLST